MRKWFRIFAIVAILFAIRSKGSEVGISVSPVYFTAEKMAGLSVHGHFMYPVSSRISMEFSIERIVIAPQHSTILVGIQRCLGHSIDIAVSVGITREDEERLILPSIHLELIKEFELTSNFHIGPTLEIAYDTNDFHIGIGLHIALAWGKRHHN